MFFSRPAGHKYVSALSTEPVEHHFSLSDFTTNSEWQDLDLSSIVGNKACLAILALNIQTTELPCEFLIDTKDTLIKSNNVPLMPLAAGLPYVYFLCISTNSDGKIKYLADDVVWSRINLSVIGRIER